MTEIWIEFNEGKWRISPDPAAVPRGAKVLWRFRSGQVRNSRITWSVYFDGRHPFVGATDLFRPNRTRAYIRANSTLDQSDQHVANTPEFEVGIPGEYKYGVRVEDRDNGRLLGDDDPLLIIL